MEIAILCSPDDLKQCLNSKKIKNLPIKVTQPSTNKLNYPGSEIIHQAWHLISFNKEIILSTIALNMLSNFLYDIVRKNKSKNDNRIEIKIESKVHIINLESPDISIDYFNKILSAYINE
jgi:hypothetical protein